MDCLEIRGRSSFFFQYGHRILQETNYSKGHQTVIFRQVLLLICFYMQTQSTSLRVCKTWLCSLLKISPQEFDRDLKPANILVSNQQHSLLNKDQIASHFKLWPVVCKLTDFKESQSTNVQTNTVLASKTRRVDWGSLVFMSPEILVKDGSKFNQASLDNLMVPDIWSLRMTSFTMINPNMKCPYLLEIRSSEKNIQTQEDVQNFVGNRLHQKERPVSDIKYNLSRGTVWSCLEEVYIGCTSFDSNMRFSLRDVELWIINTMLITHVTLRRWRWHRPQPLNRGTIKLQSNCPLKSCDLLVTNDGSNACAFLSVNLGKYVTNGPKCYQN